MDFWAQHKDFVLKVGAGVVVFLVALIAKNITYSDDLQKAESNLTANTNKVKRMKIAKRADIRGLEEDRDKRNQNAKIIAGQIGFVGKPDELEPVLIKRILSYLRTMREDPSLLDRAVRVQRDALRANLNGGFGELRLTVEEQMRDEGREKNIGIEGKLGFEEVTELKPAELEQYLLQLELTARLIRYCIDAKVDSIDEVRITKGRDAQRAVIPGGNRAFLREYPVRITFRASQEAMMSVLHRLVKESPAVPARELAIERTDRPPNHVMVDLTVLAIATTMDEKMPFLEEKEQ